MLLASLYEREMLLRTNKGLASPLAERVRFAVSLGHAPDYVLENPHRLACVLFR